MSGIAKQEAVLQGTGNGTGDFGAVAIPLGRLAVGTHDLVFVSEGGAAAVLNGFVIAEASQAAEIRFPQKPWTQTPEIVTIGRSAILTRYHDVPNCYGLQFDIPRAMKSLLKWRDLDQTFENKSSDYTRGRIFGNGKDRAGDPDSLFLHTASHPILVPANSRHVVRGIVCTGSETEVRQTLASFDPHSPDVERAFIRRPRRDIPVFLFARRRDLPLQPAAHGGRDSHEFGLPAPHARQLHPALFSGEDMGLSVYLGFRVYRPWPARTRPEPRA